MNNRIFVLLIISMLAAPVVVLAQTPEQRSIDKIVPELMPAVSSKISYQGILKDSTGSPVNATVSMEFRLYDASIGGSMLWSEIKNVQVNNGLFNTNLGDVASLNVAQFDQALYLEIAVGGETLSPRQQLLGSPYAFSLMPGASIKGSQWSPVVTVNNSLGVGLKGISKYDSGLYGDGYFGVWGNASGYGLVGFGTYVGVYGDGREWYGVYGTSYNGTAGYFYSSNGDGVSAYSYGSDSWDDGVYAYSSNGNGVYGSSNNNAGGYFSSTNDRGVEGYGSSYSAGVYGNGYYGLYGDGTGYGVIGYGDYNGGYLHSDNGDGLYASSYGTDSWDDGVQGYSDYGSGVYGSSWQGAGGDFYSGNNNGMNATGGWNYGNYGGYFTSNGYRGLYAKSYNGYYAAYFDGDIYVNGWIYKSGDVSFVMDHPTDPTKQIVYVALEGGESGVYTRGSAQLSGGMATVQLPEDFSLVASETGLTVQVTLTAEANGLYVVSKSPTQIVVRELNGGTSSATFDYLVNGIRKGYENYQPIRNKDDLEGGSPAAATQESIKKDLENQHQSPEQPKPLEPRKPGDLKQPVLPNEPVMPNNPASGE